MAYLGPATLRDRLAAFLEADPIFTTAPVPFPHPVTKFDPTTVSKDTDIDICLVLSGMNIKQGSLGPRGVGKLEVDFHYALLIYVFAETRDEGRGDLLALLTMQATEALFHYEVDPTPGSQGWWKMALHGAEMPTTFHTQPGYRLSITRLVLSSRQTKS